MLETALYLCLLTAVVLIARRLSHLAYGRKELPLPPGPPSYPVIGQILSMPKESEHRGFMQMSKKFESDIISLNFFGTTIIVLNSGQTATDLLEKRTNIYSGRFSTPMVSSPLLLNTQNFVVFMDSNDRWKRYRRMMHTRMSKQAAISFQAPQQHQVRLFLQRLLNTSKHLSSSNEVDEEFHLTIASTLLDSVYGYQLESAHDPFVVNATKFSDNLAKALTPSNFLVNSLPWLAYVPEWLPGANFKKVARQWRRENEIAVDGIYQWAKEHIVAGADEHSILATSLKEVEQMDWSQKEVDDFMGNFGMGIYGAATDTLINTLLSFVLAMVMFPEVQAKAQQEIDAVVGLDRLPTVEDRPNLPYIENLVSETLRWQPAAPLGVPHMCTKDDEYHGYRIPKGAIVFGNVWGMTRDERVYADPESFNPDRFLDLTVPPPPSFGWGGRHCPGSHFAQTALFIVIVSTLAAFKIATPLDENGHEITPEIEGESNSVRFRPKNFGCRFTPRSDLHSDLVRTGV